MKKIIQMYGKYVDIELSVAAEQELARRTQPLWVEMELLFSCFVTKRLHFRLLREDGLNDEDAGRVAYSTKLVFGLSANVVSTCELQPRELMHDIQPVKNLRPYVPRWCRLDFKQGEWQGEFSYSRELAGYSGHFPVLQAP